MVMYTMLYLKWIATKGCFIAHVCSMLCDSQNGRGLRENGCLYTHGWVLLLFTWNYYNIDNWLYPNAKSKNSKEKKLCWLLYLGESLCSFSCHWSFLVLHVVCWWTLLAHFFFFSCYCIFQMYDFYLVLILSNPFAEVLSVMINSSEHLKWASLRSLLWALSDKLLISV